ncbi:MAG: DUF5926 family protein [Acidothermaceae bacterium]
MPQQMSEQIPVVGGREPCPCGSGRRYKACHGRDASARAHRIVTRPFAGLASECDWVALREIVPAATARLSLRDRASSAPAVLAATVLPLAWPAMVRTDGSIYLGLQSVTYSSDASRDLATALSQALGAGPGSAITEIEPSPDAPRLQDLLDAVPLDVTVHEGFEFWGHDMPDPDGELAASLERASEAVVPTVRLSSVEAAYWCRIGSRTHLRWVMPDDEEPLLDALARLHAARELGLGDGSKYIGAFRAHGLVVPVWDLPPDAGPAAADVEEPAAAFRKRLNEALAIDSPLTSAERRSRAGLLSRQVTLR